MDRRRRVIRGTGPKNRPERLYTRRARARRPKKDKRLDEIRDALVMARQLADFLEGDADSALEGLDILEGNPEVGSREATEGMYLLGTLKSMRFQLGYRAKKLEDAERLFDELHREYDPTKRR